MSKAKNMALADETVPVGQYTRKALINAVWCQAIRKRLMT